MTPATKAEAIRAAARDLDEEILFADGHDDALIGLGRQFNTYVTVYSTKAVLAGLVAQGMTEEDASEWFDFNVLGAWVGSNTPVFVLDDDDD